jgi:CPA1 family monovalent cation:H+ antiporter
MGMQAKSILSRMQGAHLHHSLEFAALVVFAVICTRFVVVLGYTSIEAHREKSGGAIRQAVFMGWCGMRGFVTLATAFALPEWFPHRDTVVLSAFAVVLATLVLQGLTLPFVVRRLGLDDSGDAAAELATARVELARAALDSISQAQGPEAENLRYRLSLKLQRCLDSEKCGPVDRLRDLGLTAVQAERAELETLRDRDRIGPNAYLALQEQLDWYELTLLRDAERTIEEI